MLTTLRAWWRTHTDQAARIARLERFVDAQAEIIQAQFWRIEALLDPPPVVRVLGRDPATDRAAATLRRGLDTRVADRLLREALGDGE